MNNIDTRAPFFPNSRTPQKDVAGTAQSQKIARNTYDRAEEIRTRTGNDAKVSIPESIKDFSRIKKAVDAAPELSQEDKIADLKARIQAGTYDIDYEALADKMLDSEF